VQLNFGVSIFPGLNPKSRNQNEHCVVKTHKIIIKNARLWKSGCVRVKIAYESLTVQIVVQILNDVVSFPYRHFHDRQLDI